MEIPPQQPLPILSYGLGTWFPAPPTQSTSSAPWWRTGHQQLGLAGSSPQGFSWMPTLSAFSQVVAENDDDSKVHAWGPNPYPPGGFMSFMNSTASPASLVCNGSKSQAINIVADDNGDKCGRTEKRMLWTKQEDLRLVSAWINSSNDHVQFNYKKNDQYWKGVANIYISTTPKNHLRQVKQIKDHFARIKKKGCMVLW
ncbi:glutathione S-transferase T3-like [Panicum miliaceum]|uniref:Glutathione S-transferase T3-like n=1 Tax=Panicum miliaceum TaxID=4540 RepID=A0A3L6RE94_PANMI|nr:glutathione S-transferase T3-like [Panicum miliaceum]